MNFDTAFEKIIKIEGGYVDDPDDKGCETYAGISRKFNPDWGGWEKIDELKEKNDFPKNLGINPVLYRLVKDFYHETFWDALQCDSLPSSIAQEIFEQAVNIGKHTAVKHLQRGINLLNRNQKLFLDIKVDGIVGKKTIESVQKVCSSKESEELLFNILNILQGSKYITLMERNPVYEKYIGWFKRVIIMKV